MFRNLLGEDGVLALDTSGRVTLHDGGNVFAFRADGKLDTQASAADSRKPAALPRNCRLVSRNFHKICHAPSNARQPTECRGTASPQCHTPPL
ncbi:hypothetical protein ATK36_2960 [Amycolatopsis sulphurea]|uniref:Uncharacterized protein n=1 Tax=Amycolatopsis sulphurea TaxID=76022 RepID=A0A2A9F9Q5_9PSEU|nr:hypothetical protein [Amycolatopsis sulphurea]PFG47898.1 hypothetical protein ATK36_2960 [Amycolatopsis sulphurea]